MPYIKQERRESAFYLDFSDVQPGDWAYMLFTYALNRIEPSFTNYSQFIGELECAKMEIYRRIIAKYENQKIRENGDIECDT